MNTPFILHKMRTRSRQRGMGLVELMISMTIGLILLGTLVYIYLGTRQTSSTHDDLSRMEESGRNAMEIIGKAVRQAGFRLDVNSPLSTSSNGIGAIFGTEGGGSGAGAPSDTLTIRHDPAWTTATAKEPTLRGKEANCLGDNIESTDTPPGNVVEYVFSIAADSSGLRCATNAANPTARVAGIVENIERMQITYGLRDATGAITSYITAPATTTDPQWANVAAVRVSLLVRGPTTGITANKSQKYTFNGEEVTSTDGFLRQVYTSTFTVRNQAL